MMRAKSILTPLMKCTMVTTEIFNNTIPVLLMEERPVELDYIYSQETFDIDRINLLTGIRDSVMKNYNKKKPRRL